MTNSKTTRKALVLSLLSLLLCCSMLVGTTFAWFTDSVTSGNNKIVAGNLDIELEYLVDDEWVKVDEDTNVFEENTLWEPGHTEVVYLRVSNLGTLALQYALGINIADETYSINAADEELILSKYIEYDVVEDVTTPYATREAARKHAAEDTDAEPARLADSVYSEKGVLYPVGDTTGASEKYLAMVVYMPEEIGNEANYKTGAAIPTILLGIDLFANQQPHEYDSFGNDYDGVQGNDYPKAKVTETGAKTGVSTTIGMGGAVTTMDLDTSFRFETTETYEEAQKSPYRYWHADFVVSADNDIPADSLALVGYYDAYCEDYNDGNWVAMTNAGMEVKAGQEIRLVEALLDGGSVNYEELCLMIPVFDCGVAEYGVNAGKIPAGTTLTVELVIYETEGDPNDPNGPKNNETGKSVTIGTYTYTFGSEPSDLPVAIVTDADTLENVKIDWNTQWVKPADLDQQLESVYVFTAQDDYDAAQQSPYAEWICDYYVTLDEDLNADELVLGGNYGDYGWIGFHAPGGIAANTATPLLQTAGLQMTYEDVVLLVQEFTCGVAPVKANPDALSGTTITVELRITNPNDPAESYVITSTQYTFK